MKTTGSDESAMPVFALHTISTLSLDLHFPLYQHYTAMKLGVRDSVRHYAHLLAPLAERIIASQETDWVITAPPLYVVPSGANLLAWEIYRVLNANGPRHKSLYSADLRYTMANPDSRIFITAGEYSRSAVSERVRNRKSLFEGKWAPRPDPADFRGRSVLVVNDINVTGTQQHFLQQALETAQPAGIYWLYIVQVDATLGRAHPEIEYSLNNAGIKSFDDFAEVVTTADIDYTSRCISRLFSYPEAVLKPLIRSLDEARRKRLHQLVTGEGAYLGDEIRSKVDLLQKLGTG
jgi:hypothetical protein